MDYGEEFDSLYGPEEEEVEKPKTKKSTKGRWAEKKEAEEDEMDYGQEFDSMYGPEEEEVEKPKTKKSTKSREAEMKKAEED